MLLEGVVIVASILLAFGVDALWQNYQDQLDEVSILSNLEKEFASNEIRISSMIDLIHRQEQAIVSLLQSWSELTPSVDLENKLIMTLLYQGTLNLADGAFDSLIANGGETIANQELSNLLHTWPGILENYLEDEDIDTFFVQEVLRGYLVQMTDYTRLLNVHPGGFFTALPDNGLDEEGLLRILNDPRSQNLLARRYSNKNLMRREAEKLLEFNGRILTVLRSELDR